MGRDKLQGCEHHDKYLNDALMMKMSDFAYNAFISKWRKDAEI